MRRLSALREKIDGRTDRSKFKHDLPGFFRRIGSNDLFEDVKFLAAGVNKLTVIQVFFDQYMHEPVEKHLQGQVGGGMSGSRTMIDVVGLEHRPEQFLHLIGIFVDAPGAADPGQGIRPAFVDNPGACVRHQGQGLIPGGFTEPEEDMGVTGKNFSAGPGR
jgi:hypothetical protein